MYKYYVSGSGYIFAFVCAFFVFLYCGDSEGGVVGGAVVCYESIFPRLFYVSAVVAFSFFGHFLLLPLHFFFFFVLNLYYKNA